MNMHGGSPVSGMHANSNSNDVSSVGGFSGSIDTWNPSGTTTAAGTGADGGGGGGGAGAPSSGSGPGSGGQRPRRGGGGSNKDAFDNAGNWGDDFPAADA